jgi:hypothetical protein
MFIPPARRTSMTGIMITAVFPTARMNNTVQPKTAAGLPSFLPSRQM